MKVKPASWVSVISSPPNPPMTTATTGLTYAWVATSVAGRTFSNHT